MTESRNHHFVPQGYLRGFGWKRGKHHMVIVHDFKEQKTYEANTRNVCAQRDFMRFDFNDRAPDWLENELGKLESKPLLQYGTSPRQATFVAAIEITYST